MKATMYFSSADTVNQIVRMTLEDRRGIRSMHKFPSLLKARDYVESMGEIIERVVYGGSECPYAAFIG